MSFGNGRRKEESQPSSTLDILSSQRRGLFDQRGLQLIENEKTNKTKICRNLYGSHTRHVATHRANFPSLSHGGGGDPEEIYLGDPQRGGRCQFTRSNGQYHNRGAGIIVFRANKRNPKCDVP